MYSHNNNDFLMNVQTIPHHHNLHNANKPDYVKMVCLYNNYLLHNVENLLTLNRH